MKKTFKDGVGRTAKGINKVPEEWKGKFLTIDAKTQRIVARDVEIEDKSKRRITLYIYDLEGNPDEILVDSRWQEGGPESVDRTAVLTRSTYLEFLQNILADEELVREIIEDWKRESAHYLGGANEPLSRGRYYGQKIEKCFPFAKLSGNRMLVSRILDAVCDQVFHLRAMVEDRAPFEPISIRYIEPRRLFT